MFADIPAMTRARTSFLLGLLTLVLLGYVNFRPLLSLASFWQGLACGAVLGLAISRGWRLFRSEA